MANILGLSVKIGGDNSGFNRALKQGQVAAAGFAASLAKQFAGLFAVTALVRGMQDVISFGSRISDLSLRTKISMKTLQEFGFAAVKAGSSLNTITRATEKISKNRLLALEGTSGARRLLAMFDALGVSAKQLEEQNIETTFRQIAETIRTTDLGSAEEGLIVNVLGRSGGELITLFREGLEEHVALAQDLGIALDDGAVSRLDRMADLIEQLKLQLHGPFGDAVLFLMDMGNALVNGFQLMFIMLQNSADLIQTAIVPQVKTLLNVMLAIVKAGDGFFGDEELKTERVKRFILEKQIRDPDQTEEEKRDKRVQLKATEDRIFQLENNKLSDLKDNLEQLLVDAGFESVDNFVKGKQIVDDAVEEVMDKAEEQAANAPKGGLLERLAHIQGVDDDLEVGRALGAQERKKKFVDAGLFNEPVAKSGGGGSASSQGVSEGVFFGASQDQLLLVQQSQETALDIIARETKRSAETQIKILDRMRKAEDKPSIFE